mmetsp:Transcript_10774/g.22922  ORF Transcript_10774/g.22922 Transcript_10774/m.22922 type:complete len:506 (-) Transcript_10774:30-1547(-)
MRGTGAGMTSTVAAAAELELELQTQSVQENRSGSGSECSETVVEDSEPRKSNHSAQCALDARREDSAKESEGVPLELCSLWSSTSSSSPTSGGSRRTSSATSDDICAVPAMHSSCSPKSAGRGVPRSKRSWIDDLTGEEKQKLKSKLELETLDATSIRPSHKFLVDFPEWLDEMFRDFDDGLIALAQKRTDRPVYAVSWFFSALTSIESALWMPFVLFSLGYDSAGTVMTNTLLVLSLFSQVPKRFIWRARPWMLGRAKGVRKDPTSSFPSRGVACAIVFPVMILFAIEQERRAHIALWIYVSAVLVTVVFTTFARVNVGAHYPSDVLGGLVLGAFVLACSFASLHTWTALHCMAPHDRYPSEPQLELHSDTFWSLVSVKQVILCGLASFSVALMSGVSPIRFWLKNNYVYGLLLSSLTFRFVFLCPSCSSTGVGLVASAALPSAWIHLKTILAGGLMIALSFALKPKQRGFPEWAVNAQRLVKFLLMYSAALAMMIYFRLRSQL